MGLQIADGVALKNLPISDVSTTTAVQGMIDSSIQEAIESDVQGMIDSSALLVAKATFDASEGVEAGDVDLDLTLPSGALVVHSIVVVGTTFTSSTDAATIAVTLASAGDICAAAAISAGGNVWDAATKNGIPVLGTATTAIALTAEKTAKVTVAEEALTAGDFTVYLFYVV